MKGLEIRFAANRIASDYISHGKDMNSGIAKIASDKHLNDDQISRLVEESNKATFLASFEKTGEQVFNVASLHEVKESMAGKMEKKATVAIEPVGFSNDRYRQMMGDWKPETIEKVASEQELESAQKQQVVLEALDKLASDYRAAMIGIQKLESLGFARYNNSDTDYLIKTASAHNDADFVELQSLLNTAEQSKAQYEYIFEKHADIVSSLALKTVGLAGKAVVGTAGAVVPVVAGVVGRNPGAALNAALMGPHTMKGIKVNAAKHHQKFTGPVGEVLSKTASFTSGIQHTIDLIAGASSGVGGIFGGILGAAAKKLGGGIALTMNEKEFNNSFDTIMNRNPSLADRKTQMREYFDVVARHSPTIAKDPIVAEGMVKNFDAFGGIDFNTIKAMNEMEAKKDQSKSSFKF